MQYARMYMYRNRKKFAWQVICPLSPRSLRKRFCASGRIPELLNSSSWPLIRSALMVSVGGVWLWHVSALVTAGRLSFLACEALVEMVCCLLFVLLL